LETRDVPSLLPSDVPSLAPSSVRGSSLGVGATDLLFEEAASPTLAPSASSRPSDIPSFLPSIVPSDIILSSDFDVNVFPSLAPSAITGPSDFPSLGTSDVPSLLPSDVPSLQPSEVEGILLGTEAAEVNLPTLAPSASPEPSNLPSLVPSLLSSDVPSLVPSDLSSTNGNTAEAFPTLTPSASPGPSGGPSHFLGDAPASSGKFKVSLLGTDSPSGEGGLGQVIEEELLPGDDPLVIIMPSLAPSASPGKLKVPHDSD